MSKKNLISPELKKRCDAKCEMCSKKGKLFTYIVSPKSGDQLDDVVAMCNTCLEQVENPKMIDITHWRCLDNSMWSLAPSVQVLSYRMLSSLIKLDWARELLVKNFLDDELLDWAENTNED